VIMSLHLQWQNAGLSPVVLRWLCDKHSILRAWDECDHPQFMIEVMRQNLEEDGERIQRMADAVISLTADEAGVHDRASDLDTCFPIQTWDALRVLVYALVARTDRPRDWDYHICNWIYDHVDQGEIG
jgi:hypothetical protein